MSGVAPATRAYLDLDVDGHQAAYLRCCAFVEATNLRYGWSSKLLSELGGSERARIAEAYASDFDWSTKGRIELDPAPHVRLVIKLYTDVAPNCCANFASLCAGDKGKAKGSGLPLHYLNSHFHRFVPGALLQGGDFAHSNGSGGESIWGGRFKDEKGALRLKHSKRGLVAMGNTGVNSNGSQFYITLSPQPKLDGKYCIFGEVESGMELLDYIEANVQADKAGVPSKRITILGCGKLS